MRARVGQSRKRTFISFLPTRHPPTLDHAKHAVGMEESDIAIDQVRQNSPPARLALVLTLSRSFPSSSSTGSTLAPRRWCGSSALHILPFHLFARGLGRTDSFERITSALHLFRLRSNSAYSVLPSERASTRYLRLLLRP
jgi:hypothetical protein